MIEARCNHDTDTLKHIFWCNGYTRRRRARRLAAIRVFVRAVWWWWLPLWFLSVAAGYLIMGWVR